MEKHLTLVAGSVAMAPAGQPLPLPPPDAATHAHLSVPAGAYVKACSRNVDAAVWRDGAKWHLSVGPLCAPLDQNMVDAACTIVVEVSCGYVPIKSAQRIVSMMPGAFASGG